MKQLTIIVPNGDNNLPSITGAFEIFSKANAFWQERGRQPLFAIQLAGTEDAVDFSDGIFTVKPHIHIAAVAKTDLIIIPSLNHNYDLALHGNDLLLDWLIRQHRDGAEIATICTGSFLLAATGLLDGRNCATHWAAADTFRRLFPAIQLQPEQLITDENRICTNGGAYSFLNLMVYLVEKHFDRQTAVYCAKVFQIEIDRNLQSEFAIFTAQKQHDDPVVHQAQTYIEGHLSERISVEALSARFHVGRRNFDRRFIKATGGTPTEYAQRVKIEAAKKALETERSSVSEIMYAVGYADVKAFRELFRRITGLSPLAYKEKYYKAPTP